MTLFQKVQITIYNDGRTMKKYGSFHLEKLKKKMETLFPLFSWRNFQLEHELHFSNFVFYISGKKFPFAKWLKLENYVKREENTYVPKSFPGTHHCPELNMSISALVHSSLMASILSSLSVDLTLLGAYLADQLCWTR